MKPFYVTTPIYYVNDKPHIGHAYSTIAADVLCRFARVCGRPARMLTGTDEHGQKIERKAKELSIDPKAFVDKMAPAFGDAFRELTCDYDDFIRTTEPRHIERVQRLWSAIEEAGDLYLGEYEGWYSVSSEAYLTEKELLPGNLDPVTKKPVERVREASYFFRLSKYTEPLLRFYEANPNFVQPQARFNEVKSFVKGGLRDLSVSRTSFHWGVPVPGDSKHVMYVWLDALTNYISALGGPAPAGEAETYDRFWPPTAHAVHIVGKDILRFHAVYWPAFLMSAGIEPVSQVWAHGWLTVDGEKMSKSSGNFIPPGPLVRELGVDTIRYFLMRELAFGQDGDFSHSNLIARHRGDLGNGLGNLLHRMVSSIVKKSFGGKVPEVTPDRFGPLEKDLIQTAENSARTSRQCLEDVAPHRALESIWELVAATNRYVDQTTPWALAKEGKSEQLEVVSYAVLEVLRWLSVLLWPFIPGKADELRQQLGLKPLVVAEGNDLWPDRFGELEANTQTNPGKPLFPRIDEKQEAEIFARLGIGKTTETGKGNATVKAASEKDEKDEKDEERPLDFKDFTKVEMRVGVVLAAEAVPKSDKLLKLQIDLGEGSPRQVLSGIRKFYQAEDMIGRSVVVVANLAPRRMMGLESQGMVLAASHGDTLKLISPGDGLPAGTRVS